MHICWTFRSVLKTNVVFDQSRFVKVAVKNVINEGAIGLCLTALMILSVPGKLPRHDRRAAIDSDLLPGDFSGAESGRELDQHNGAGRTGAGAFAA